MELFCGQKLDITNINTVFGVISEFEFKPTTLASRVNYTSLLRASVVWTSGIIPPVVVMVMK